MINFGLYAVEKMGLVHNGARLWRLWFKAGFSPCTYLWFTELARLGGRMKPWQRFWLDVERAMDIEGYWEFQGWIRS